MLAPLARLENAVVQRAFHTFGFDSVRLEFGCGAIFIAYNDAAVNEVKVTIHDASREFHGFAGAVVESIVSERSALTIRLSQDRQIRIGLCDADIRGPEAFQILLPGYPPVVEQNL